jgi:formamidopyrimidine-DNA glycosylase
MPELPDVEAYVTCLWPRIVGQRLEQLRIGTPFVLRTVTPTAAELAGTEVVATRRLAKRVVIELQGERFIAIHLMIAGRLHWRQAGAKLAGRTALAAFDFATGTLVLTEASSKKRAAIHLIADKSQLAVLDRGGLEVQTASLEAFRAVLARENRTLKRALTDPRLFSGIGNAYSDEILHHAHLSPVQLTSRLSAEQSERLYTSTHTVLAEWTERLRTLAGESFPEHVTAFRDGMAVHGRFGKPCPRCGTPVQRITYAENEANYCPPCQTEGKLLADRALSRLLRGDWPRTLEELEEQRAVHRERVAGSGVGDPEPDPPTRGA